MPLAPPAYRKTAYTHRRGLRADQPDPEDVLEGTLYYVTDEDVIERSNGAAWQTFSLGTVIPDPLTVNDLIVNNDVTTPIVQGGTSAGSDLTLKTTTHGSPSGDEINLNLATTTAQKLIRNPNGGGVVGVFGDSALKYTFMPANSNAFEYDMAVDVNFTVSQSTTFTNGVAFQSYNDAVNANIPLEFRGKPIALGVGALVYHNSVSAAALSAGNNNDLNPTNLDLAQVMYVNGNAGGSVITGVVPTIDGTSYARILLIINVGTALTFAHESASSSAANRFNTPGGVSLTLSSTEGMTFLYSTNISRWIRVG